MGFVLSDELLGVFAPIVVYWVYSGIYVALSSLESYRLHSVVEEEEKNLVSKANVVKGVLFQQFIQAIVAILLFTVTGSDVEITSRFKGKVALISHTPGDIIKVSDIEDCI